MVWCVLFNSGAEVGWEVIIAGFVHKVTAQGEKNSLLIRLVHPVVVLLYVV